MKWFRFYDEVLDDPKAQRLSPVLFRHWVNLLCLASRSATRGDLPPMSDIAFALRVNEAKARAIVSDLVSAGLIDQGDTLQMHNWSGRQRVSDNVADRVSQHRSRNKPVTLQDPTGVTLPIPSDDVTVTVPHVRATDTETEQIQRQTPPDGGERAAQAPTPPTPAPEKRDKSRGTRLPESFLVTDAMREWARAEGLSDVQIDRETAKFRDHWRAESGQRAVKLDWDASWKNWMRRALEIGGSPDNLRSLPDRRNSSRAISTSTNEADWLGGRPAERSRA